MSKRFNSVLASRFGQFVKSPLGVRDTTDVGFPDITTMLFTDSASPYLNDPSLYRSDLAEFGEFVSLAQDTRSSTIRSTILIYNRTGGGGQPSNVLPPPNVWPSQYFGIKVLLGMGTLQNWIDAFDAVRDSQEQMVLVQTFSGIFPSFLDPVADQFRAWLPDNHPNVVFDDRFGQSLRWIFETRRYASEHLQMPFP